MTTTTTVAQGGVPAGLASLSVSCLARGARPDVLCQEAVADWARGRFAVRETEGRSGMQVDAYTRFVLTIIALCLVLGLARDLAAPAQARGVVVRVDVVRVGGLNVFDGKIPVK